MCLGRTGKACQVHRQPGETVAHVLCHLTDHSCGRYPVEAAQTRQKKGYSCTHTDTASQANRKTRPNHGVHRCHRRAGPRFGQARATQQPATRKRRPGGVCAVWRQPCSVHLVVAGGPKTPGRRPGQRPSAQPSWQGTPRAASRIRPHTPAVSWRSPRWAPAAMVGNQCRAPFPQGWRGV